MSESQWFAEIDNITDAVKKEFGSLSAAELNWKANEATWSVGQVLDHLIVINDSYEPIIQQLKGGTYKPIWLGRVKFLVKFFGDFILQSVEPTRKRKMKTFPIWEPSTSTIDAGIVSKFELHQNRLKDTIRSCAELIDRGAVISSPANRIIVYRLDRAFDIIIMHEKRHLEQARELNKLRQA